MSELKPTATQDVYHFKCGCESLTYLTARYGNLSRKICPKHGANPTIKNKTKYRDFCWVMTTKICKSEGCENVIDSMRTGNDKAYCESCLGERRRIRGLEYRAAAKKRMEEGEPVKPIKPKWENIEKLPGGNKMIDAFCQVCGKTYKTRRGYYIGTIPWRTYCNEHQGLASQTSDADPNFFNL